MISTPVFAQGASAAIITGLIVAGTGGAIWATSDGASEAEAVGVVLLGLGGVTILLGLMVGMFEWTAEAEAPTNGLYLVRAEGEMSSVGLSPVSQNDTISLKAKDSIFNHLLLGTDGRNTYLGVRFSW